MTPCLDPARRYLEDAFAVAKDRDVAPDIKSRVIPGLCRLAVEVAARDMFMARRFTAGHRRVDVEDTWQRAETPSHRLALAVHDDKAADLGAWLNGKPWRRPGRQVITKSAHEGLRRDPLGAIRNVERIVHDLQVGL